MLTDSTEVRCDTAEKRLWKWAADLTGKKFSAWIREQLNDAARREITQTPEGN